MRVESWEDAEGALAELARVEAALMAVELDRAAAEETARLEALPLEGRRERLASGLERFCRGRGAEFTERGRDGRRSRRLVFGRMGFRRSVGVSVADEQRAIRRLGRMKEGGRLLRRRIELDREAVRECLLRERAHNGGPSRRGGRSCHGRLATELHRAGVRLEARDNWFFELLRGAAERWA